MDMQVMDIFPIIVLFSFFRLPHYIVPYNDFPVLQLSNDNIRDDEAVVTCEHPITRKSRLDKYVLRFPSTVAAPEHKINA